MTFAPQDFTRLLFLSLIFFLGTCTGQSENDDSGTKQDSPKPNIVLIYADDLGWADVGYQGAELYETPNIDKLASEGMKFTRFYPSAANCAPSRACMLTGMYTPRHDVYVPQGLARGGETENMRWKVPTRGADDSYNTFHVSINNVEPKYESLAELLNKMGYSTARFGKWHIGDDNQGFDISSSAGVVGEVSNIGGEEKRYYDDIHVAERMTDAAIEFMSDNRDNPFFLYLAHWEVHTPMAARVERINYYRNKIESQGFTGLDPVYAAEVEQVDLSVGRVMEHLKEKDLESNTVFIFTSDNGGVSRLTSNKPLRAGKGTFYEGGIRTPMCVRWPGVIQPGSSTDIAVIGVDFMPTFAELAGVPLPANQPVDGESIVPIFRGQAFDAGRSLFFHFPLYLGGGGVDQVLPTYNGIANYWRAVPLSVIMKGKWKLIYYYEYDSFELFDLENDMSESHDLATENTQKAEELVDELMQWVDRVDAPVPEVPNN